MADQAPVPVPFTAAPPSSPVDEQQQQQQQQQLANHAGEHIGGLAGPHPDGPTGDVLKLFSYFTSEFKAFLAHVEGAVQTFQATGAVPEQPLYKVPEGVAAAPRAEHHPKPRKVKRDKIVRKPTAFNHYVKEKIKELRASGLVIEDDKNNNEMFKRAVSEWGLLSKEQKEQYGRDYRAAHAHENAEAEAEDARMEETAQLMLDNAHAAQQAATGPRSIALPDLPLPQPLTGATLALQQPAGQQQLLPLAGGDPDGDQISLTALVTGGEDQQQQAQQPAAQQEAAEDAGSPMAAAPPPPEAEEEPGRKRRRGAGTKIKT